MSHSQQPYEKNELTEVEEVNDDDLINKIGYGKKQFNIITFTFIILSMEGLLFTIPSAMIIPLTNLFQVSTIIFSVVCSIFFFGVGIGSASLSFLSIHMSRENLVKLSMFILVIFSFMSALATNIIWFGIFRFFSALGMGILTPIGLNILLEYLPLLYRDYIQNAIWSGFIIGSGVLYLAIVTLMPSFEINAVQSVLIVTWFFFFITMIFIWILCQDSPRNLIVKNKKKEALEILHLMAESKGIEVTPAMDLKYIQLVRIGQNQEKLVLFKETFLIMFSSEYFWNSLILLFIWFGASLISYGYLLVVFLISTAFDIQYDSMIISTIIAGIISFLGQTVVSLAIEKTGVKLYFLLTSGFLVVSAILIASNPTNLCIWNVFFVFFSTASFNAQPSLSSAVYPTKIRDSVLGILFSSNRLGTVVSQVTCVFLFNINPLGPIYLCIAVSAANFIFAFFIKYKKERSIH